MDHQVLASPIDRPAFYEKMLQYRPEKVAFTGKEKVAFASRRQRAFFRVARKPDERGIIRPFGTSCPQRVSRTG
jgi:hypothetical protein